MMTEYKTKVYLGYKIAGVKLVNILSSEEIETMMGDGYLHKLDWYHTDEEADFIVGITHKTLCEGEGFAVDGSAPPLNELMKLRDKIKHYIPLQNFPPRCPDFIFGLEVS